MCYRYSPGLEMTFRSHEVVLSMVGEMMLVDVVASVNGKVALGADQRKVFRNRYSTVVEEHVMIGTEAQHV